MTPEQFSGQAFPISPTALTAPNTPQHQRARPKANHTNCFLWSAQENTTKDREGEQRLSFYSIFTSDASIAHICFL